MVQVNAITASPQLFLVPIFLRDVGVQGLFDSVIEAIALRKGVPVQKNEQTKQDSTRGASGGDPSDDHSSELPVYDLAWAVLR